MNSFDQLVGAGASSVGGIDPKPLLSLSDLDG
jgi:hypothetical protein